MIDATFFGREYGYLCFSNGKKIIYLKEIKTENVSDLKIGLLELKKANYNIKSVTIDGKRGYINNIKKILGKNTPIQMCLFHQKAIVRRYITDNPRSQCGADLKEIMKDLCNVKKQQDFINNFHEFQKKIPICAFKKK